MIRGLNMDIFTQLENFSPKEPWGDPKKVNGVLLLLLQEIRTYIGNRFVIHNAYETKGHSENSQHYIGNAVDFHIERVPFRKSILDVEEAIKYFQVENHIGLGIYPEWHHPGFHLDVRGTKARWGFLEGRYVPYEQARSYAMNL